MKRSEYNAALEGLKSNPQRHLMIHGRRPHCVEHLDQLAKDHGIVEDVQTPAPERPVAQVPEPPQQPAEPPKPQEPKPPKARESRLKPEGKQKGADGAPVEIPENLGTLKYNELRSLAAKLGVKPLPSTQADLLAAIEAMRPAAP